MTDQCEYCKSTEGVLAEPSRILYHTELPDDHPENPNRDVMLCRDCAAQHHSHWDEMWDDHNRDIMAGINDAMSYRYR